MNIQCARCFSSMFALVRPDNPRMGCAYCAGKAVQHNGFYGKGTSGGLRNVQHHTVQVRERTQDLLCR